MANGMQEMGAPVHSAVVAPSVSPTDAEAIRCASQLFLERGISQVKMTDIAEAAGVGVATLYRHFSTKAELAALAATLMWERLLASYEELVATPTYVQMDGASRLELLLSTFCDRYVYTQGFAAFLDELDRLILAGDVTGDVVSTYAQMLGAAYPYYEEAYATGLEDGSIARAVDFPLFYRAVAHALVSVAGKLARGEVLPSDDFSHAREELGCIIDMAVRSLRS